MIIGQFHKKNGAVNTFCLFKCVPYSQDRACFYDRLQKSEAMDLVDFTFDIHEAASWRCVWLYVWDKAKSRCAAEADAVLRRDDRMGF